ncbi:MAG: DUF2461 domain-containing protein [Flammeovirgaceae bacterium]
MPAIKEATFNFLLDLKENNNREWFQENKAVYTQAHENVIAFADALLLEMQQHDDLETPSGKKSLFRIYRDVRFSKNKSPYKSHFSGSFKRATKALRGGYYFHIEAGNTFAAGGFWGPNSADLKHLRNQIAQDPDPLREILASQTFNDYFGELIGDQVKTAPKGFSKDDPAIDLLRFKQFILKHDFTDEEALSDDFVQKLSYTFQQMRPFLDYMSDILTTDLNGISLIE